MSDLKCCLCFPIECGVKTLGFFFILHTVWTSIWTYLAEEATLSMMWPFIACSGIMAIMFIVAFVNPSEQTRKLALLTYVCLALVVTNAYYLIIILNGAVADANCTDQ